MTPSPKVFYVLARPAGKQGPPWAYWSRNYDTIPELIGGTGTLPTDAVLLRVTEVQEPPKRELVTSGDLSLLDGPCVVHRADTDAYVPTSFGRGADLENATVFDNQSRAIQSVGGQYSGPVFRIIPIREVPGRTTYKEEVLA